MNSPNISNYEKLKQTKSKVVFQKIKNNYILKQIFEKLKTYTKLEIIKYNKQIQKRLNLSVKDYKEYCQLYSSIEIELKVEDNECNKLINISDKEKKYFHIYLDNSNKETKRNYLKENENAKNIKTTTNHQVKLFKSSLHNCSHISSITFKNFIETIQLTRVSRLHPTIIKRIKSF